MKNTSDNLFKKYWHAIFMLYAPIYMICFMALEKMNTDNVTLIHMPLDDIIPFCEYFIIPYILWFVYIAAGLVFFFFYSQKEFIRYTVFLISGMSICLIIYAIFPNGVNLRPESVDTSNICGYLVNMIYTADTSTNVFPSIHCLNSFATHIAISKCSFFKKRPITIYASAILTVSICLSTVFLKQHSVWDFVGAVVLAAILYIAVYVIPARKKQ